MRPSLPPPSANQAASALLHLGLTLTAVLGAFYLLGQFGPQLHLGKTALYVMTVLGSLLILRSLVRLARQTMTTRPASPPRQPLKNPLGATPMKSRA